MPKLYVHDFYFEDCEIKNKEDENDFCSSLNVYYNFSPENPGDGWDDLEFFNITVATPFGLAKYLDKCIKEKVLPKIFFYSYLLIVEHYDKSEVMNFIKAELQAIYGKSENEIILKAIRKFSWESEKIPDVYNRLFSK
jgi:hypothetical protein